MPKGSKGEGGFVDVWKRGYFAWEYKRKDKYKNLEEAYRRLYQYRDALDNPPLSVVCDIATIEIRPPLPRLSTTKTVVKLASQIGCCASAVLSRYPRAALRCAA